MITKILKVKNLGRLNIPIKDDVWEENTNDDFSFKKNTLIFGDNTLGKTTLVSIFKSIKNRDSLEHRKKFNSANNIQIKIENNSNGIKDYQEYWKESWENDNILIFDNDFIKDHVFSEDQIKGEHLKSLPKVLIGNDIKEDIDKINLIIKCDLGSCDNCEYCLNNKLSQHKSTFSREYKLDQFLTISTETLDIDEKIKEKEKSLSIDDKLFELKTKSQESIFYKLDIQLFENLFDKKINNVFASIIERHLSERTNNLEKAKGFLGYGLKLKKGNICPFCSQDTTNVQDFMDNLSSYFDTEYIEFKNEIESFSKIFLSFDLEKELLVFGKLDFTFDEVLLNKATFEEAMINIKIKVEKKKEDLNFNCSFQNDTDFILVKDVFIKSKKILIELINKAALTLPEKTRLKQDLISLKLNKYRYSTEGIAFHVEYKNIEKKVKDKGDSKKIAQDALKKKVDTLFEDNLKNINIFLTELRADFKITKLIPSVDNRDRNNYLKINEYLFEFVDINGNSVPVETSKFKETFSDSDKRLLGFAFFLSVLKNDHRLDSRIIILDDPFSSFDLNRKEETIKLFDSIKNFEDKTPAQKIIFTHEKSFYCQCNNLISSNEKKLLKLNFSQANNGTMFELVNIKEFEADKYYEDIENINKAIFTNNHLDDALPKARECAEYLLRAKYINTLKNYRDEKGRPINFDINSIDTFLKAIDEQKCTAKNGITSLNLHRFHHNIPQWKSDISDTAKQQILKDFIGLIEQI